MYKLFFFRKANFEKMIQRSLKDMPTYRVNFKTSDIEDAGTDANVYIKLYGRDNENHRTETQEFGDFNSPRDDFEAGNLDTFTIHTDVNISNIDSLRVRHDNSGNKPGWHLEYIELLDDQRNQYFTFNCNRWLALDENPSTLCYMLYEGEVPRPIES